MEFMELTKFLLSTTNMKIWGVAILDKQHAKPTENNDDLQLQDLISRIVNQDQAAFSTLFNMMSARIYSVALRITGNAQLAEEVTEDAFFQVWRQAPRFDPARGAVKAWVLTIARSRALDARRSIPPFDTFTEFEPEATINDTERNGLPDLLSAIEQNHGLHAALEKLDSVPRQLLALAYFRGLSHEEIAEQTKLPLGTVKSHLRRAILHLRKALRMSL